MATEVPVNTLKHEVEFYGETEKVQHDIDDFKDRLNSQNEEFNLLLEYYMQNKGRIDVYHAQGREGALHRLSKPNLGTRDESWYYLDERGNKIWVKNMSLDVGGSGSGSNGKKGGAGAFAEGGDGKSIVVTVPKAKKSYALPANYRRCTDEYDAYRHRVYANNTDRPASAHSRHFGGQKVLLDETGRVTYGPQAVVGSNEQQQQQQGGEGAAVQGTAEYIEFQKRLHAGLANRATGVVRRPPATMEEAEARLAQLRQEEKVLRSRLH